MDDVFEEARRKIGPALIHEMFQCAGSFSRSGEYYILSPIRADRRVGSFSINETTGLWRDKANDESGDFINLVSRAKGITPLDAAKLITGDYGNPVYIKSAEHEKARKEKEEKLPAPVLPIPDDETILEKLKKLLAWFSDPANFDEEHYFGKATKVYRYYNYQGDWQFVVVRFEKPATSEKKREKNDILFYYGDNGKWKAKRHKDLMPFQPYGIEKLKDSSLPILIVEGEKCKTAAEKELDGKYNVISWLGGTANIQKTDWGFLKTVARGRKIYFWPDADSQRDKTGKMMMRELQPGMSAALYVKAIIPELIILEVYRAFPIETEPAGYDVADYIEEGKDASLFIEEFTPYNGIDVDIDAHQVYRSFIDHFFDHDNLEQFGGWYWTYNAARFYWERIEKIDIMCNLQRWFEETGLQWVVSKKCEVTEFIGKVAQYITRHSNGYVRENPLKDSAVSPYIHFANGAIKITKEGSEWFPRDRYSPDFFRKLFPISCLDINVDYENYKTASPEHNFPAFYFFVKEMIPREYMEKLSEDAKQRTINETLLFFAQVLAYTISAVKPNEYVFGLYGNEQTGKSFFVKIIKSLIGREFCSERPIEDMENRFAISGLWGKKVYIEPDLKTRQTLPEAFIKSYAGEQITTIEAKNKDQVDGVKMSLTMFFVSNYEFVVHGTEGVNRRLVLVPFRNKIEKHDTRLLDKITGDYPHGMESGDENGNQFDERPGLISLALQGWELFRENEFKIKTPDWITDKKKEWSKEANAVTKFIDDYFVTPKKTDIIERGELYKSYTSWSDTEGRKPLGKKNFLEEIRKDGSLKETRINAAWYFSYQEPQDEIPF